MFIVFAVIYSLSIFDFSMQYIPHEKINLQNESTFHWLPYKRSLSDDNDNHSHIEVCIESPSSINDFPHGLFTREQRLHGFILLHIFAAVYFFIILAIICDKYFIPTVDRICKILKISPDVAATTFMATATTIPEFFTNTISTFVAESDMGLSAIVGSALFNTLGVAACASLFAKQSIQIDWWPVTRDSILFCFNICVLVILTWDGVVMWWETCILVTLYVLYWILMFQNNRIMNFFKNIIEEKLLWCQRIKNYDIKNQAPKNECSVEVDKPKFESNFTLSVNNVEKTQNEVTYIGDDDSEDFEIWKFPKEPSKFIIFWYLLTWIIRFLLHYTIPNPITHKKLFPLSFIMCVIWIGCTSYMVFWMVVIIGDTLEIPEPVMGLTFLAFGGCMPEAISAVIIARRGSGQMGVSNALGANCLAILFSLGLPWFITTMIKGAGFTNAHIHIYSYGMEYTIMILILAVITLYSLLAFSGYKLEKKTGIYLVISYFVFVTFAVLMEYNVFLVGAPAEC